MKLTAQQEMFVDEYIKLRCKNATQAAINAGYSKKTASSKASHLIKNSQVSELIEKRKSDLRRAIQDEFVFDALTARKVMAEILSNEATADKDKITVARDFLDRAGFAATEKVEASVSASVAGKVTVAKDPYEDLTTDELKKLLKLVEADEQKN